jgi:hypothetical protein
MRSDYALYTVAIIFFIITGIVLAYEIENQWSYGPSRQRF